jgi:hypothetical protein
MQSSVLAANNPFADLLSSSDATPDSVASEDLACDVGGSVAANNPFLSSLPKDQDDMDFQNPDTVAAAVTQDDPWSSHNSSGLFRHIESQFFDRLQKTNGGENVVLRCSVVPSSVILLSVISG